MGHASPACVPCVCCWQSANRGKINPPAGVPVTYPLGLPRAGSGQWPVLRSTVVLLLVMAFLGGCQNTAAQPNAPAESVGVEEDAAASAPSDAAPFDEEGEGTGDEEFDDAFDDEFAAELDEEFAAQEPDEVSDPLEGYNRVMTTFNDRFYLWVLEPVAEAYSFVMPEYARQGVDNFFENLLYPLRLVNNLLQAKFADSGEETLRFVTNSTIGVFGLWDPADKWFGLEAHDEDFGQTLGVWGVGPGPHIVLPILGPSNMRDLFSLAPDILLDPRTYVVEDAETWLALKVFEEVSDRSLHIGEYENLKRDAIDLYPFLRDIYEQHRAQKILE